MSQCKVTQENLYALLPGIVQLVVEIICREMNMPIEGALKEFYESETYARLENERTKFWHFGPVCLFQCFQEEKTKGTITL